MIILKINNMHQVTGGQGVNLPMVEQCRTPVENMQGIYDSSSIYDYSSLDEEAQRQAFAEDAMLNISQSYDHVNLNRWNGYA